MNTLVSVERLPATFELVVVPVVAAHRLTGEHHRVAFGQPAACASASPFAVEHALEHRKPDGHAAQATQQRTTIQDEPSLDRVLLPKGEAIARPRS